MPKTQTKKVAIDASVFKEIKKIADSTKQTIDGVAEELLINYIRKQKNNDIDHDRYQ